MGVMEKIKEIESEMARTQKNKATNVGIHSRLLSPSRWHEVLALSQLSFISLRTTAYFS